MAGTMTEEGRLISIQDKGILLAVHVYNEMVIDWMNKIKRKDSFDEALEIEYKLDPRVAGLLADAMLVAYLQGHFRAKKEVAYQLEKGQVLEFADLTGDFDFAHSSYGEAIDFFKTKKIIPSTEFKAATSMVKSISFSIAGLEEKNFLQLMQGSIKGAMDEGMPFRQWAKNVDKVFTAYGVTPLRPHHLETVFRTNTLSAYSVAKHEATIGDDNVAGYEYSAVMDDRTRDEHAKMNGFKAAKNDPVWARWWPPNDYNCRCTVTPLTHYQMQRAGLKFNTGVPLGAKVGADFTAKAFTLGDLHRNILTRVKAPVIPKPAPRIQETAPKSELEIKLEQLQALKTIPEIQKWATDNAGIVNFSGVKLKPQPLKDLTRRITELKSEWVAERFASLYGGERRAYARGCPEFIKINNSKFNNPKAFERDMAEGDVYQGWHPRGTGTGKAVIDHEWGHVISYYGLRRSQAIAGEIRAVRDAYFADVVPKLGPMRLEIMALKKEWKVLYKKVSYSTGEERTALTLKYKQVVVENYGKVKEIKHKISKIENFISEYAEANLDEFTAESLSAAMNDPHCSKYAKQTYDILKKYFWKGGK
jgi:SPP1 gp7 family putative phage head morphogenesis protein